MDCWSALFAVAPCCIPMIEFAVPSPAVASPAAGPMPRAIDVSGSTAFPSPPIRLPHQPPPPLSGDAGDPGRLMSAEPPPYVPRLNPWGEIPDGASIPERLNP